MKLRVDVPPTFPPGCRVVFCGEADGPDEIREKRGFVGRAGRLLDRILFVGGVRRSEVGITNVVKRAPDCDCGHDVYDHDVSGTFKCSLCKCTYYNGFDSEHFKDTFYESCRQETQVVKQTKRCETCNKTERQHKAKKATCINFQAGTRTLVKLGKSTTRTTQELADYIQLLKRELEEANPNIVVACGAEALKALCGIDGITKYRGSILPSTLVPGLKVVPLLHPSWILRKQAWQEVYVSGRILRDKVVPQSWFKEIACEPWTELLMPTIEQVEQWFDSVSGGDVWVLDIETRQSGHIACVGLCATFMGVDTAICVPIQTTSGPYFSPEHEERFWRGLQALSDRNPNLVMQNGFFDLAWLATKGFCPTEWNDTMLLSHRMFPELPKKLAFTNMLFTDIPYYKDDGRSHKGFVHDDKLWRYNLKDCVATLRIWKRLLAEPGKDAERKMYFEHTLKLKPIAFEMQSRGLDAERPGVMLARKVLLREYGRVRRKLIELSNGELKAKLKNSKISDAQIHDYLYGTLGLPAKLKRDSDSATADEDAIIELMIANPKLEVLKCILAERKFFKALTSYIDIHWAA